MPKKQESALQTYFKKNKFSEICKIVFELSVAGFESFTPSKVQTKIEKKFSKNIGIEYLNNLLQELVDKKILGKMRPLGNKKYPTYHLHHDFIKGKHKFREMYANMKSKKVTDVPENTDVPKSIEGLFDEVNNSLKKVDGIHDSDSAFFAFSNEKETLKKEAKTKKFERFCSTLFGIAINEDNNFTSHRISSMMKKSGLEAPALPTRNTYLEQLKKHNIIEIEDPKNTKVPKFTYYKLTPDFINGANKQGNEFEKIYCRENELIVATSENFLQQGQSIAQLYSGQLLRNPVKCTQITDPQYPNNQNNLLSQEVKELSQEEIEYLKQRFFTFKPTVVQNEQIDSELTQNEENNDSNRKNVSSFEFSPMN